MYHSTRSSKLDYFIFFPNDTHTNPGQSGDASDIRKPRFGAQATAHSRSLAGRAGWIIRANGHQNAAYG